MAGNDDFEGERDLQDPANWGNMVEQSLANVDLPAPPDETDEGPPPAPAVPAAGADAALTTQLADQPFLHFNDMLSVAPDLIRMKSYLSVYQYVSQFVKDDFLRRCFSFHPLLIGGNPFDAPSIYAMIHYLEREWGVHYVMGGTGALVAAMGRLFEDLGGVIHLNTPVSEITVDGPKRRVTGVRGCRCFGYHFPHHKGRGACLHNPEAEKYHDHER